MIDRRPALVARCLGVADVIAAVQFARERDLLLCIKGGGHNIAGLATAEGALMLDMSLMRGVWVTSRRKVAHAQAGCLLGNVDRETQLHGMAAVLGFVSLTGIAGLTLGGGFGYLTTRWGFAADNVAGMDVVTANGRLVRASREENEDLFWGLRGGGGNFGVVTGFDYALHAVGPEVLGGLIAWRASDARGVLELYRALTEKSPPELSLMAVLRPAPVAPWVPADQVGKPIVVISACCSGRFEEGQKLLAQLRSFGTPIVDTIARRPYTQIQSQLDFTQPKGRRNYWKSEYLPRLDPALCDRLIEHTGRMRSPHTSIVVMHVAGALNRLGADHSPVGNRDAHFALLLLGSWEREEHDKPNI